MNIPNSPFHFVVNCNIDTPCIYLLLILLKIFIVILFDINFFNDSAAHLSSAFIPIYLEQAQLQFSFDSRYLKLLSYISNIFIDHNCQLEICLKSTELFEIRYLECIRCAKSSVGMCKNIHLTVLICLRVIYLCFVH